MGGGEEVKAGDEEVNVNIRCSNGSKFSVQINLDSKVESFKTMVAEKCDIPPHQQRLIYKGRIVKDDQTLRSYGLVADHAVHLVQGFAPNKVPLVSPNDVGGLGGSLFPGLGLGGLGSNGGLFGTGLPELEQVQRLLGNPGQ